MGNQWQSATLTLVSKTDFKLMFEGTTTGGYQGDIALDDILMDFVPCANSTKIPQTTGNSAY